MSKTRAQSARRIAPAPAPGKRGRGRPRSCSAPDDVLFRVAFDAFAEHGYDGTTMRDLADMLGVSHGFMNARFGSKEELWCRTIDYVLDGPMTSMNEIFAGDYPTELARLKAVITRMTEFAAEKPSMPRLFNEECRLDSPRLDYLCERMIAPFSVELKGLLERVAAERGVPCPDWISFMLSIVDGIGRYFALRPLIERLGGKVPRSKEEIRHQADVFAARLLAKFQEPSAHLRVNAIRAHSKRLLPRPIVRKRETR